MGGGSFFTGCIHCRHFFGHVSFIFFVFFAVGREFIVHVIRVFVIPVLFGVIIGEFGGATLLELLVGGIGQGRIHDDGSAGITAFDEVTGADGVFADCGGVFLAIATISATLVTGTEGVTTRMFGTNAARKTGSKSFA